MTELIDPADGPGGCKRSTPQGPCTNMAEPNTDYCSSHGGVLIAKQNRATQYELDNARARHRVAHFANHTEIYSSREEIGMLRHFIETLQNNLNDDPQQLALSQAAISGFMNSLMKMQAQSLKHETECKKLYSEQQIVWLIKQMVNTTSEVLVANGVPESEVMVDQITRRMASLVWPENPDPTENPYQE